MDADCWNEECGWRGNVADCVVFKHGPPDYLMCPECHEHIELEDSDPETLKAALDERAAARTGA